MRHPLLLLFPIALAATRFLVFGTPWPSRPRARLTITADTECEILLTVIFCLTGFLFSLYLVTRFPDLGATIVELNQF